MSVLIVETQENLGQLWCQSLRQHGVAVGLCQTQEAAIAYLRSARVDVIVLNLMLGRDNSLAIADYASYRQPSAKVMFVTNAPVFSDGSIFEHSPNACAFLPAGIPPEDLAAMVMHHGQIEKVSSYA